jgi:hypothetical protein
MFTWQCIHSTSYRRDGCRLTPAARPGVGIIEEEPLSTEWLVSALIVAVATPAFGHFETVRPLWTRIARWLVYLGITGLLGVTVGRPWTFVWIFGLPLLGATFHVAWCLRHGINPLTAEPRDRYEQLRARRNRPPTEEGSA